jgi:glycosyltransferase involved in cell wall biosynthesis
VRFLGYRSDIPSLLKSIDILVMPSEREAFGMAAIEAMSMEVPIVATSVGGLTEVVVDGRTGVLVPPQDPNRIAAELKGLIQNPQRRSAMGVAGREHVLKHFSLGQNVDQIKALYRRILAIDGATDHGERKHLTYGRR